MGTDNPADVRRVVAHELGHTWNQLHTPCGNPPNVDPNYPYTTGMGVYGFDLSANTLKPPSTPDIMGYCANPWISDYIYSRVINYRELNSASSGTLSAKQAVLLVWGRIVNGRPLLEPSFQIVTRPKLPIKPGPYTAEAIATDGSTLFSFTFDAAEVADDPSGSRPFVFAVPMNEHRAAQLASLRVVAPGGVAAVSSLSTARGQQHAAHDSIVTRRSGAAVRLEWNASVHPMLMVRDPDTGEVLTFARGGNAQLRTSKQTLDLELSDGVRSHRAHLAISRR
jgi:hypothetical protein